jgi:hypothetical protein
VNAFHERLFGADLGTELWLTAQSATDELPARLEITADVGDRDVTVALDADGVRKLRLALARYERTQP